MYKKYVYILESLSHPEKRYTGITSDLQKRLKQHNQGQSSYTAKYIPWKVSVAVFFEQDQKAAAFEPHLAA